MNNLIIKEVNFENINMVACKKDNKIFAGIKSICDGLGVDYSSQLKRIYRDDILPEGVVKMTIPTGSGEQEANMIDIMYLPFFLIGIKSEMCRDHVRLKLKSFKLKAKDILADAFINKNKINESLIQLNTVKEINKMLHALQDKKVRDVAARKIISKLYGIDINEIALNEAEQPINQGIKQFIETQCQYKENAFIGLNDLYYIYTIWCRDNHKYVISKIGFSKNLKSLGYTQGRVCNLRFWKNITLQQVI